MVKCHNCSYTGDITDFDSVTKQTAKSQGIKIVVTCPKCNYHHNL